MVIAIFALFVAEAKPLNIIGAAIIGAVVSVAFINALMTLLHKTKKRYINGDELLIFEIILFILHNKNGENILGH